MIRLGVDPGSSRGAAVVLDTSTSPARVVDLLAWSEGQTRGRADLRLVGLAGQRRGEAVIGLHAALWLRGLRGVERASVEEPLHGHHRGGGAVSMSTHAEAGEWRGGIRALLGLEPTRPGVTDWRKTVLGMRSAVPGGAPAADKVVARLMPALVDVPDVPEWARGHVFDACGVALWVPR